MKLEKKTEAREKPGKEQPGKEGAEKNRGSVKNAGMGITPPGTSCSDRNCPFHGDLKVRGRIFTGHVMRSRAQKTATISWERMHYIPKYERYERRFTKIQAHNPPCINAVEEDIVKLVECRPLSKTKHFVIVGKLGRREVAKAEDATAGPKEEKKEHKKEESKDAIKRSKEHDGKKHKEE